MLPMSPEEATCVLAHQEGVHLDRYLDEDKLSRIRQLIAALPTPPPSGPTPASPARARPAKPPKAVQIAIAGDITLDDPMLSSQVLKDMQLMAGKVYPMLYVFENSVRALIRRVMTAAYGDGWWPANVPREVRDAVDGRMKKEERNAWHGKRSAHPLYYTDIKHLKQIATSNWQHFAPLFPNQAWFTNQVDVISVSRNVVAHNNPLRARDVKRLEVYFEDWEHQIGRCVDAGLL